MSLNAHLPDLGQPPENAYLSCVKRPDLLTISSFFTTTCVENVLSCTGEWRNVFLTGISDRTCSRKMRRYRKQKKALTFDKDLFKSLSNDASRAKTHTNHIINNTKTNNQRAVCGRTPSSSRLQSYGFFDSVQIISYNF